VSDYNNVTIGHRCYCTQDKGDGREKDCDHIFMDDSNTYADLDAGDTYYAVPEDVACGDKKQPSCTLVRLYK
jgi:hypothetical protein